MSGSTVSRRVSEFVGVALFAAALIWIVVARQLRADRPGLVLQHRLARRAGSTSPAASARFSPSCRSSCSATRPISSRRCSSSSAGTTSGAGRSTPPARRRPAPALLFACVSAFLEPRVRHARRRRQAVPRRRLRRRLARRRAVRIPEPHRLAHRHRHADLPRGHHVDAVLVRPLLRRDPRGRGTGGARTPCAPSPSGARTRRREKQRREVIAKHTKKSAAARRRMRRPPVVATPTTSRAGTAPRRRPVRGRRRPRTAARSRSRRRRSRRRSRMPAPTAAAADPEPAAKAPAERRKGEYTLPPAALLDAPKTERKIDERELMDGARLLEEKCREFSVEGSVVADPSRPGGDDVRVQAGRRREVLEDHRPGRRPVPRDAGRVGPDRPHPGQVHRRHPDSERDARADFAARAARIRGLPALDLEADDRARQDHPRRAVHRRPRRRCRTC